MNPIESEMSPERRARWLVKGRILYGKSCRSGGRGICAESFALHHLEMGEPTVARDLADFLDERIQHLRDDDPDGRLAMTRSLVARIRGHLEGDGE